MTHQETPRYRLRLTRDMAMTIVEHFDRFAGEGVVTLEVNSSGIWFVDLTCEGVRFVGQADPTAEQLSRMRSRYH